jgi:hypothetical protein
MFQHRHIIGPFSTKTQCENFKKKHFNWAEMWDKTECWLDRSG